MKKINSNLYKSIMDKYKLTILIINKKKRYIVTTFNSFVFLSLKPDLIHLKSKDI